MTNIFGMRLELAQKNLKVGVRLRAVELFLSKDGDGSVGVYARKEGEEDSYCILEFYPMGYVVLHNIGRANLGFDVDRHGQIKGP